MLKQIVTHKLQFYTPIYSDQVNATILANTGVPPVKTFAYTGISRINTGPTPWISVVQPGSYLASL